MMEKMPKDLEAKHFDRLQRIIESLDTILNLENHEIEEDPKDTLFTGLSSLANMLAFRVDGMDLRPFHDDVKAMLIVYLNRMKNLGFNRVSP